MINERSFRGVHRALVNSIHLFLEYMSTLKTDPRENLCDSVMVWCTSRFSLLGAYRRGASVRK